MKLKIHTNKYSSTFYTQDEEQLTKLLLNLGLMNNNWLRTTKSGNFFTLKPKLSIEHKRYIEKHFVCKEEEKHTIITGFIFKYKNI